MNKLFWPAALESLFKFAIHSYILGRARSGMLQTHGVSGTRAKLERDGVGDKVTLQLKNKSALLSIQNPFARTPLRSQALKIVFFFARSRLKKGRLQVSFDWGSFDTTWYYFGRHLKGIELPIPSPSQHVNMLMLALKWQTMYESGIDRFI